MHQDISSYIYYKLDPISIEVSVAITFVYTLEDLGGKGAVAPLTCCLRNTKGYILNIKGNLTYNY